MKTPLVLNRFYDCCLPGSPSDSRLFHADDSDRIWVCLPHVGRGYYQTILLQDDLALVIQDYILNQSAVMDNPGRGDCLEFEFCLAGIDAGYSSFVRCP